jgi:hypothetical protein
MSIKLTHFTCPGADNSTPQEGYEVVESNNPFFHSGDFVLDIEAIKDTDIQVVSEDELDFDPFDLENQPW